MISNPPHINSNIGPNSGPKIPTKNSDELLKIIVKNTPNLNL